MLNHLRSSLQLIIFISILLCDVLFAQLVFSDFKNKSDYKGKWQIEKDVPVYIADYLREKYGIVTFTPSTFFSKLGEVENPEKLFEDIERLAPFIREINATHYITGTIEIFEVSRYNFSEPSVAGYEHYNCVIRINLKIYNVEKSVTEFSDVVEGRIDKGSLGINLFGKPSEEKITFYNLDNLEFGSEQFNSTIVGITMKDFCENLVKEFRYKNPASFRELRAAGAKLRTENPQETMKTLQVIKGDIILSDELTAEIFVNLGSEVLKLNDVLIVYEPDSPITDPATGEVLGKADIRIGEIKVSELRGPKLSLCRIIKTDRPIIKGMIVKKLVEYE